MRLYVSRRSWRFPDPCRCLVIMGQEKKVGKLSDGIGNGSFQVEDLMTVMKRPRQVYQLHKS